ncbi:MAG TPA: BON domain-containing protein [Blastocatellia bacterium]|nr:BON domain-containing protein [Blastocatellia bacterium]
MIRKLILTIVISAVSLNAACVGSENENAANRNNNANANANANEGAKAGGDALSDAMVNLEVKLALIADGRTSGFATDVDTRDGQVTLSGKVDTEQARTAADEVAKKVSGVKSVNNQLQVVPEAKRKEVDATDEKITDAIEKAMETDPSLTDVGLSADSNNGVVTLDGTVETREQLVKAAEAIRKVPGVKSVDTKPVTVSGDK